MSAYVEVDHSNAFPAFSDPSQIFSLTEGSFSLGKDYDVFDALAHGRSSQLRPQDRDSSNEPLIAPRGIPLPCSVGVGQDYFRLIASPKDLPNRHFWPESGCVAPEVAKTWIDINHSHLATFHQWFNCSPEGRNWQVVSQPGLYNASWLFLAELDESLNHHNLELERLPVEYQIIRMAMEQLVRVYGSGRVRLVIWFN